MQVATLAGSLLLPFFVTLQVQNRGDQMRHYLDQVLPLVTVISVYGFAAFGGVVLILRTAVSAAYTANLLV